MSKICPVCHTIFKVRNNHHTYCCSHCRKIHHKTVYYDKKRPKHEYVQDAKIIRTFFCNKCKKQVFVTNPKDRRTKFCSPRCEKLYWKHPRQKIKNTQNAI